MSITSSICLAIWAIGTIAFFSHELWLRWRHPDQWERRQDSVIMPDWQVWLAMIFWPVVFGAAILFSAVVYISTNATVLFVTWRSRKRKV